MSELLFDGPEDAPWTVALAHGAGAAMETPFMNHIVAGLTAAGVRAARFEFPYMAARRDDGKKRPPDRPPVLRETWESVIASLGPQRLVVGGKSLGGRVASLVADGAGVAGLVCLGYPFHPPGRPEKLRTEHLADLRTPTLICQGTRDPFGGPVEVAGYALSPSIEVLWLEDGDHSFKPRKASGRTEEQNLDQAVAAIVGFVGRLSKT